MKPHILLAPAVALLLLAAASPLSAQLPITEMANMEVQHQRYTAEVFADYHELMKDWRAAWTNEDDRKLARLYQERAVVVLPGGKRLESRETIQRQLREELDALTAMETGLTDFHIGGTLAYGVGWFKYDSEIAGVYEEVRGTYVVALRREGRNWRILSQVLLANPPAS